MQKIRLAISIVTFMAVVVFGLTTSTFRVAKADEGLPECNCPGEGYSGRRCNGSGTDTIGGIYCCAYQCDILVLQ